MSEPKTTTADRLVNGKHYPMWQGLVDNAGQYIGGKVFNFDMGMKAEATIRGLALLPNGSDSAMVEIQTDDKDDPWFFDVRVAGIGANDTDEPGLAISAMYIGTFVLQKPHEALPSNNGQELAGGHDAQDAH